MDQTFEFVSVRDWCRQARDPRDLATTMRTWMPMFDGEDLAFRPSRWVGVGDDDTRYRSIPQQNLGLDLNRGCAVSGSQLAHLGPAVVRGNQLLVLVKSNLAITECYGDERWRDFQLASYGTAHNIRRCLIDVDGQNPQPMAIKAYRRDPRPTLRIDRPCLYLSSRFDERNYYHWLFEVLPRLRCLDLVPELRGLPLLVYERPTGFQAETLDLIGCQREVIVTEGRTVEAADLFYPSIPSPPALNGQAIDWLRDQLMPGGRAKRGKSRFYVSRHEAAKGRVPVNESAIVDILTSAGFSVITPGLMSVRDQIAAFRDAAFVVGCHGAAFANLLFAPEACRFLELMPDRFVQNFYQAFTQRLGIDYGWMSAPVVNDDRVDINVDLERFKELLQRMLLDYI